jgi:hypothetical protein
VLLQTRFNTIEHDIDRFGIRQCRDAEVVVVRRIEAAAGRDEYVMVFEQIERERLIIESIIKAGIEPDKRIHGAHRPLGTHKFALFYTLYDGLSRLVKATSGLHEIHDALKPA